MLTTGELRDLTRPSCLSHPTTLPPRLPTLSHADPTSIQRGSFLTSVSRSIPEAYPFLVLLPGRVTLASSPSGAPTRTRGPVRNGAPVPFGVFRIHPSLLRSKRKIFAPSRGPHLPHTGQPPRRSRSSLLSSSRILFPSMVLHLFLLPSRQFLNLAPSTAR